MIGDFCRGCVELELNYRNCFVCNPEKNLAGLQKHAVHTDGIEFYIHGYTQLAYEYAESVVNSVFGIRSRNFIRIHTLYHTILPVKAEPICKDIIIPFLF